MNTLRPYILLLAVFACPVPASTLAVEQEQNVPQPGLAAPVIDGRVSDIPDGLHRQLREDFEFMESIRGGSESKLHAELFGRLAGRNYIAFFRDRVGGIFMSDMDDGPTVMARGGHRKIYLTERYATMNVPRIARLQILLHEARHTEDDNLNWHHSRCPDPFILDGQEVLSLSGKTLAGNPACDKTPIGAYGITVIMLKNIQKSCANCSGKMKADSGLYADDMLRRIIDPQAQQQLLEDLYK